MNRYLPAAMVTVLALGVATAALGSGLDRMSAKNPALAGLVPPPFRANAWRGAGALALAGRHLPAAQAAATEAVRRDPMDAASASALGMTRLTSRDGSGAAAAFRVAAQLGWRDMSTQLYWMAVATNSGDFAIAAERADALLRQDAQLREQPLLLAALERLPGGRKALATRLALRPEWFGDYWNKLYLLKPEQLLARARVLDEPALHPARMTCSEVNTMVGALLANRRSGPGRAILKRYCGAGNGGLLADGGFERARIAEPSPFGWQFTGAGGLDVRLEPGPGDSGKAVVIDSALPMRQIFASQTLQLPPGSYRVSWRMPGSDGTGVSRIVARLTCQQNGGDFLAAAPSGGDRYAALARVNPDCPLQWLDLAIDPGEGAITVDDVTVTPAR